MRFSFVVIGLALWVGCQRAPRPHEFSDVESFNSGVFSATHNSYSGLFRSSIVAQLDAGVRFLELDIHDDEFARFGFRVGHDRPGHQVDTEASSNPAGWELKDWLQTIADWSNGHAGHSALIISIDAKTSLLDADGASLADLEEDLVTYFGPQLVRAHEIVDVWPTIGEMRDRVVAVLSGHEQSRLNYHRETGTSPVAVIDDVGNLLVGFTQDRTIWLWTGRYAPAFAFHHRVLVGQGRDPVIGLDDSGALFIRYQPKNAESLAYRYGYLDPTVGVRWGEQTSEPDPLAADWPSIVLREGNKARTERGGAWVEVYAQEQSEYGKDVLWLTSSLQPQPVLLQRQRILFSEAQFGDAGGFDAIDPWFVSASAKGQSRRQWAIEQRARGRIARLWQTNHVEEWTLPAVQLPATDYPLARWYLDACRMAGCVK